jgi:hypothetical protein
MDKNLCHDDGEKKLLLTIEGKQYDWFEEYITGEQIKHLAGIRHDEKLFLKIEGDWDDEPIPNDQRVNLARPGIEHFYVQKKLRFTINKKEFEWNDQFITGKQIRELGHIGEQDKIFLDIEKPFKDEAIGDETIVDLARPGEEHFISKPIHYIITVNSREHEWKEKMISYDQVVLLAFPNYTHKPNQVYTVTYKRGIAQKPEGSMVKGDSICVKNKMIFNVTETSQS